MDPMTMMALASAANGFLGGSKQPELPPEMKRIYEFLMRLARERKQYAKGIPGSSAQEQATLAQAKTLAGAGLAQQYEGLQAALRPNDPGAAEAMGRFQSRAGSTLAGIDTALLAQFLNQRQNALSQAGEFASRAVGPGGAYQAQPQGTDLGGALGQWLQMEAFKRYAQPDSKPDSPPLTEAQKRQFGEGLGLPPLGGANYGAPPPPTYRSNGYYDPAVYFNASGGYRG